MLFRSCKDAPITVEFNSIAAGYIIDRLAERFANQGIHDYLIEVTGEIRAAGEKPGGHPWLIAIEAPLDHDRKAQRLIQLKDEAISTSGDYRNYREENGRHEVIGYFQCLLAIVWLGDDELIQVNTELTSIAPVKCVLGIYKSSRASLFLGFGNRVECKSSLTRRFWTKDFNNPAKIGRASCRERV